jgi:hypothetical protein
MRMGRCRPPRFELPGGALRAGDLTGSADPLALFTAKTVSRFYQLLFLVNYVL